MFFAMLGWGLGMIIGILMVVASLVFVWGCNAFGSDKMEYFICLIPLGIGCTILYFCYTYAPFTFTFTG